MAARPLPPLAAEGLRAITWNVTAFFGDAQGGELVTLRHALVSRMLEAYDIVHLQGLKGHEGAHGSELRELATRHDAVVVFSFGEEGAGG